MDFKFTKRMPLLSVTLALATLLPGIAFAAPGSMYPTTNAPASNLNQPSSSRKQVRLTTQQRQQMQALRAEKNRKIEAILTPSQRTQLTKALQSGQKMGSALKSVNLTAAQKTQIQSLNRAYHQQMRAAIKQAPHS